MGMVEILGGLCAAELGVDGLDAARLLEVHRAHDAVTAELDADELGRLAEDVALVDGGVWLDARLVEDRAGALWVKDEEVV